MGTHCPLCWERHVWSDRHDLVAVAPHDRPDLLIAQLSKRGVPWPAEYDRRDAEARSYGMLRQIADASTIGIDCAEVHGRWVVSRAKDATMRRPAMSARREAA
jgi:hypothetical protein